MRVIGLTGGIGTGKSTASSIIKSLNIKVIDCDIVSREVVKDKEVLNLLEETFGNKVITSSNELDRKQLGKIVFKSKENLNKLNSILHPIMKIRIKNYIKVYAKTEKLCIVDGAILIEAGFCDLVDDIILISSSEELQLKRVNERDGHSYEYIKDVIKSQMPLDEKKKYCKYIIENNEGIDELREKVENVIKTLLDLEA
ncbi:dephospho-CoA kinase [Clostridium cylindrosporum]|uniref:Dephospho-CoA kinase n=1 Tax=Clostridium cylindrosporum DSM 605 TaxID=1121307 RepID=A0A0J8D6Q6_CLOCY|nr:dephospho-CoA kinase [Clostridium cylindrosporum]KMT21527.1 dephospho-CoA kinase CoaE [Clostridium cylindrosporum DSM 605]